MLQKHALYLVNGKHNSFVSCGCKAWFKRGFGLRCRPLVIAASHPVGIDLAIALKARMPTAHCPDCSAESVVGQAID